MIVWLINFIRSDSIGYVWFLASRLAIVVPPLQLLFTIIAVNSYGKRDEVSNSWFGTTLTVSSSGVATIPLRIGGVSDYKYLMFKDQNSVPIPSGNYSMAA